MCLIRTVKDLRNHLSSKEISPEKFSEEIKISNMTIRRLLKKPGNYLIPEKYHAQLDLHLGQVSPPPDSQEWLNKFSSTLNPSHSDDFSSLLSELEENGKSIKNPETLKRDIDKKLKDPNIGQILKSRVLTLFEAIRSNQIPVRHKAVCMGAILYLLNPFDLIPDAIPGIGYLDDFAVITLALGYLARTGKKDHFLSPKTAVPNRIWVAP